MRFAGRSPQELAFRLRQAAENFRIWALPPSRPERTSPSDLNLPAPDTIRRHLEGSTFQARNSTLAADILEHRLPLFEANIDVGPAIDWRRDYIHGKTSGTQYFRFVPYLNFDAVGDHKNIWELNRHQHLVVLAQAQVLTGEVKYGAEICRELESWWQQNPFLRGINWTSALEVAFRALSWLWIDHLIGTSLPERFRRRIWNSLYQHGAFLECNLSTYFSPNTHLLGEAVALHALGMRLNEEIWKHEGARIVSMELQRQVARDGSHFEQSTYYHVYALDLFLLHYLLAGRPEAFRPVLNKMAHFLAAVTGPERLLTCFGDDDGGRLFYPYGPREKFARATLATCSVLFPEDQFPFETEDLHEQAAWWLACGERPGVAGQSITERFPDSGLTAIVAGRAHILIDTGAFGDGSAGHNHADTLSVTVRSGSRELLIDPGTFTYISDPRMRDLFRGTGFHNTIRVDGADQADPSGPFRWLNKPSVHLNHWESNAGLSYVDASCVYRGFTHRRRVLCVDQTWLFILDEVEGPEGEHLIEQFWHLGDSDVQILLSDPAAAERESGLRSRVLGQKEECPVIRVSWKTKLPHICGAALNLSESMAGDTLQRDGLELSIPGVMSVSFASSGMPLVVRAT